MKKIRTPMLFPTTRFFIFHSLSFIFVLVVFPGVRGQVPTPPKKPPVNEKVEESLLKTDRLTAADPFDKTPMDILRRPKEGSYHHKIYQFKMNAGKKYQIDMIRSDAVGTPFVLDPFLRLEDSSKKPVAFDDDSGGNQNARIILEAPRTDTYRIIATTFGPGQTGGFTLKAGPYSGPWPPAGVPVTVPAAGSPAPVTLVGGKAIGNQRDFGAIVITYEPMLSSYPGINSNEESRSYLEHRFTVRNKSEAGHRVTMAIPRSRYGGRGGIFLRSIKRTVDVEPKSSVPLSLFQPDLPTGGSGDAEVIIDGETQRESVAFNMQANRGSRMGGGGGMFRYGGAPGGMSSEPLKNIFTVPDLANPMNANIFQSVFHAPPAGFLSSPIGFTQTVINFRGKSYNYPHRHRFAAANEPVKSWTKNWLAYSSFDGIAINGSELENAPTEVQSTLWQFVECGGGLLVAGPCKTLPESWQRRQSKEQGFTSHYPAFGQCLVTDAPDPAKWQPDLWKAIVTMWDQTGRPWTFLRTPTEANNAFPVVDNLNIPVRGLFVVMLLFAILIGPVNLVLLSKKRRRIWLLWTVPVFSFLTCVAVVGFMVLSEGWKGQMRAEGITVLDEVSQRATSIGWMSVYTPLTPGDGLHFGYDTEVTPHLKLDHGFYRGGSSPRSVNWTDDQHFDSGWVAARVPAHFMFRSSETRRPERALVSKEADGSLTMVNGLSAKMIGFWLADKQGKIHEAVDVGAGNKVILTPTQASAAGKADGIRQAFGQDWLKLVDFIKDKPGEYLRPGCYLAVLDATPFFDEGLHGAQPRRSRTLVYGIMKDEN